MIYGIIGFILGGAVGFIMSIIFVAGRDRSKGE